jgi:predicted nucleic acid-binding protein
VAIELFHAAVTRPDAVFCDTSFIVDVLTHEVAAVAPALKTTPAGMAKAAASATFYNEYRAHGTQFFSSPHVFSEAGHVLSKGILGTTKQWQRTQRQDPRAAARLEVTARRLVLTAWRRIQAKGIGFTVPAIGSATNVGMRVDPTFIEAVLLLKRRYPALDWADAHHIAAGLACGTDWFATTDQDWKSVAHINVFCDS